MASNPFSLVTNRKQAVERQLTKLPGYEVKAPTRAAPLATPAPNVEVKAPSQATVVATPPPAFEVKAPVAPEAKIEAVDRAAGVKPPSQFDLQRAQVAADRTAEEKRRSEAVERALTNQGLGDSGILEGALRAERANVAQEAGRSLSAIGQEEARQSFAATEAEKGRVLTREGMAQAKELALAGLDIQKSALALQEKGMDKDDARFYASLAQADAHAQKGFSLQESALELQKQGMGLEDTRFYASLGQAKYLAEQGLTLEEARIKLTEKGMNLEDARFFAGLAFQERTQDKEADNTFRNLYLSSSIAGIDPKDPAYQSKLYDVIKKFNPDADIGPRPETTAYKGSAVDALPGGGAPPKNDVWVLPSSKTGTVTMYWDPDAKKYDVYKNDKYAPYYG